jgi:hypothetical protein
MPFYLDYNTYGGVTIQPGASQRGLIVQLAASPTQDAVDVMNSASTILYSVQNQGHLVAGGTQVTATTMAGLGSAAPAMIVTTGSTDARGSVTFGTGTAPTSGNQFQVVYATAYGAAPYVGISVSATSGSLGTSGPYVSVTATTSFTVATATTLGASAANTVYGITYWVIG